MKQSIKDTIIPFFMLLIIFSSCSNNPDQKDLKKGNEETLKVEREENHSVTTEDSVKFYNTNISVTGDIQFPLNLTVDSLKKMNVVVLDSLNTVCQSGALRSQSKNSRGVLLRDIINKAGIKQLDHADRNFYIVARASDGYKATFSWAELFNNPTGEHTYIIFEENNQPIIKNGAMVLSCNNDIKTGPRHVNWLKSIEVKRVD